MSYGIVDYIQGQVPVGSMVRCPFHDDNNASAHVMPGSGKFYCFVCNIAGSQVEMAKRLWFPDESWVDGMKLAEALMRSQHYPVLKTIVKNPTVEDIEDYTEILTKWCKICCINLSKDPGLIKQLQDERAIKWPIQHGMGVASLEAFYELNQQMANDFPQWELKRDNLLSVTGIARLPAEDDEPLTDRYRLNNRIIIPEIRNKRVIHYQARSQQRDHMYRYLNPKISLPLYGLESMNSTNRVALLVEGVFDMIPLKEIGASVIASVGIHLSDNRIQEIKDALFGRRIIIMFDNDPVKENGMRPGHDQALQTSHKFLSNGISSSIAFPSLEYKDVGEWIVATSAEYVLKHIYSL